jgi:hypothetical protein
MFGKFMILKLLDNTRVGAVNKEGFVAAFETDGVVIDITSPVVSIR